VAAKPGRHEDINYFEAGEIRYAHKDANSAERCFHMEPTLMQ
jgi:hypothetical protein